MTTDGSTLEASRRSDCLQYQLTNQILLLRLADILQIIEKEKEKKTLF